MASQKRMGKGTKMGRLMWIVMVMIGHFGFFFNVTYSHADQMAVVITTASDYSSGAHSVVSVDPVGGPRRVQNKLAPTQSDITVAGYGKYFYRLGRYKMDHITKFDINAPDKPIWQYSVLGADKKSANPYDMIFVSHTKAYVLRYGSAKVWIVNPSATTESAFKIGELDLSAYDDGDGAPEMASGIIVDGKLFITMQRWDTSKGYGGWNLNQGWIAVFNTQTDTEIQTGKGNQQMKGIPLPAENPQGIQYVDQMIYVQCAGSIGNPRKYSGGIVQIHPNTYETTLIWDDGNDDHHPYGNITGMSIVSSTQGYFVGYVGWGDNTLYEFNPSTGTLKGIVLESLLKGKNIAGMESGVYTDKNGRLWVCNASDAEIIILNTRNNSLDERVSTELNPQKVIFVETQESVIQTDKDDNDGSSGCFIQTIGMGSVR